MHANATLTVVLEDAGHFVGRFTMEREVDPYLPYSQLEEMAVQVADEIDRRPFKRGSCKQNEP